MGSAYVEFMARLTEAQLCLDGGQEADGLQALAIAMALGRARGYVNSHVWIPAVMAGLCARALEAGIEEDYVRGLVQKRGLVPESPPVEVEAWPWPIRIFTLGRFEVMRDGEPVRFARKVQRKPLALLKALIALGGRSVREEPVMDALWPDAEGDAARVALASALHRLRGLLGREQAVLRQEGQLSLDARLCWVDVWAVERLLGRAETAASPWELTRKAAASTGAVPRRAGSRTSPGHGAGRGSPTSPAPADRARRAAVRAGGSTAGRRLVRRGAPRGPVCRGRLPGPDERPSPAWTLRRSRAGLSTLPDGAGRPPRRGAVTGDPRPPETRPAPVAGACRAVPAAAAADVRIRTRSVIARR